MNRLLAITLISIFVISCGPKQLESDDAFDCLNCENWNLPQEPFRIYGNTWYVGTTGLSSILIKTDDGLILIDGALPQSAPLIDANIRKLGFNPHEIEAILLSHAHYHNAGGINALQRMSGAVVYTSDAGHKVLTSGELQDDDPQYLRHIDASGIPAVNNVEAISNREIVSVGMVNVTAIYTPGHTPGGITWTWESCALGRCYDIVYADSLSAVSAEGYYFSAGPAEKQIVESANTLAGLDCDILLSPHPFFFGMQAKLEKRDKGNPFVNNVACMIYAETALNWLEQRLQSEGR
ncbi:MAG: subclass B3 metallo-beta-lactamase [Woeseiaceae bacterium]|nr:subclass B3 metallo-beta-lactamase [Woeseiaceae bacterium]